MIEKLTLTEEEIVDVTGYRRPSRQQKALADLGFKSWRRPDGTIAVLRSQFVAGSANTVHPNVPHPKLRPA